MERKIGYSSNTKTIFRDFLGFWDFAQKKSQSRGFGIFRDFGFGIFRGKKIPNPRDLGFGNWDPKKIPSQSHLWAKSKNVMTKKVLFLKGRQSSSYTFVQKSSRPEVALGWDFLGSQFPNLRDFFPRKIPGIGIFSRGIGNSHEKATSGLTNI